VLRVEKGKANNPMIGTLSKMAVEYGLPCRVAKHPFRAEESKRKGTDV
jgi:hypothetical protein